MVLTKGDEYPIHQLPEPVATAGTDRNFYDRFFFNGYTPDGSIYFAIAFGVYPHLNIMDASFSVVYDGIQHNVRASREMGMERMDLQVGPISIEIVEPLDQLRIRVNAPTAIEGDGISADLLFRSRYLPIEEPRFTYRRGPRMFLDYTRLTQQGSYEGFIQIAGKRLDLKADQVMGTRDRSWGVRPIGASDPQPLVPAEIPQFYWLWSPINYDDAFSLYHVNEDAAGNVWNTRGVFAKLDDETATECDLVRSTVQHKAGTRHASAAKISMILGVDDEIELNLKPIYNFYQSGIGYTHPEWGHGHYKGPFAETWDCLPIAETNEQDPIYQHVQAFVEVEMTGSRGSRKGRGILEQLVLGPHAPSGFKDILDFA